MTPNLPPSWTETEPGRLLGPVERICAPHRTGYVTLTLFLGLLYLVSVVVCFGAVAIGDRGPYSYSPMMLPPIFWVGATGLLAARVLGTWLRHHLRTRLILGRDGVAIWTPGGAHIVLWADLGTLWRPVMIAPPWTVFLVDLAGRRFQISSYFQGVEPIVSRVLEELSQRARGTTWAERPAAERPATEQIIPAPREIHEGDR
jgi:hypothetical protein